jgi:hypothetical protein
MGIFNRKHEDGQDSQPEDVGGDGPLTLEDRVSPGGATTGVDANQGKTEPMSPTGTHAEPLAPVDLDSMNVGGADPQAPRHPDALRSATSGTGSYAHADPGTEPTGLSGPGATPDENKGTADLTSSTGRAPGPEKPVQLTTGEAHRAPGLDGSTPAGESVTTDVDAGAARMGPQALDSQPGSSPGQGDDRSVFLPGGAPASGTSEEHQVVAGIKLPEESTD